MSGTGMSTVTPQFTVGNSALGHVSASSGSDDAHTKAAAVAERRLCARPCGAARARWNRSLFSPLRTVNWNASSDVITWTALNLLPPLSHCFIFTEVTGPHQYLHSGRQEITYPAAPLLG